MDMERFNAIWTWSLNKATVTFSWLKQIFQCLSKIITYRFKHKNNMFFNIEVKLSRIGSSITQTITLKLGRIDYLQWRGYE